MTQALIAHAYRFERIPEEQYLSWQMDSENPTCKELIAAQEVLRKRPWQLHVSTELLLQVFYFKHAKQKHFRKQDGLST